MNLYSILSEPAVYDALQNLLGTRDRGRYVRSQDEYLGLLREFFRKRHYIFVWICCVLHILILL